MRAMQSPAMITLGNHSESILRGMAAEEQYMPPANSRFTQTSHQPRLPMMPNMQQLSAPSRPIRISRRKPMQGGAQPHQAAHAQQGEDLLSASPTELKMMYDEATWRMYHLIQSARMDKQTTKAATAPQVVYDDSFFALESSASRHTNAPPTHMNFAPAVVSPDEDYSQDEEGDNECVFELDDL